MENNNKTIWIIDHYSSEPQNGGISRHYDFANELSMRGYKVIVISSSFSHYRHTYLYDEDLHISEVNKKAHYVYLRTTPYQSNGGLKRITNCFSFLFAVLRNHKEIASKLGKPDVVLGCSVHPLTWIAAYRVAKYYKVRFCAEVRDLWPEMWLLNGEKSKYDPMVLFFGTIEKWAYRKADHIIYSMPLGDRYLHDKLGISKEKISLIGQPLDIERYEYNAKNALDLIPEDIISFMDNAFTCVFTGYYKEYEGVHVMLEAAKIIKERDLPVKFVFVGSGEEEVKMHEYKNKNQLDNVYVGGRVAKEAIPALLRKSDVCLAHCAFKGKPESFKYGLSKNKINEYFYSDSVIIYGFDIKDDAVATSGAGYVTEPFNAEEMADNIEEIYKMSKTERDTFGDSGKTYIQQHHKADILMEKMLHAIKLA